MDSAVDNYLRSANEFLGVIHASRKAQLHPSLLTSEQLEPIFKVLFTIFKDIQDHSPRLGFPVPGPRVGVEELAQVATITVICKNEIIRILLDVPFVDETDYAMYELHPVPEGQNIFENRITKEYIRPTLPYLFVDQCQRKYTLMSSKIEPYVKN